MEQRNHKYHIIYGIMLAFFVGMIVWVSLKEQGTSMTAAFSEECMDFSTGWMFADGSEADVDHLNENEGVIPYETSSVFRELPQELGEGKSLCFRSKNIFYEVYVDGELRYEPEIPESRVYNESFGTRWSYIPLYSADAGKLVEVRFYTVYEDSRACMDYLCIGSAVGVLLSTFAEKSVAFITCLLMLFVGLLLIVADIPINMQEQKNHELLYLGLFAVSVALWCVAESNLLQFFTNDSRLVQSISCCSLILISIPMVLYLDAAFGFRRCVVVPFICYLSAAEFLICTILHFVGIMDYHDTLTFSHIVLGITAVVLVVTILQNAFRAGRSKMRNVYKLLRAIGLTGIAFATGIDIIRYYIGNGGDSAMFVRIGLLVFILCYGSSSLEKTINAVKLGVQSEFVSQLAYRDGLTGLGNRTAFQERLVELEKYNESESVAIIMFDVNDLKYINDNMGHKKGDELLVCCANLIQGALERVGGDCYRIGGDEFSAVLQGENIQMRCEDGILLFKDSVLEYNAVPGHPFRISIARGYAIYERMEGDVTLMDVYQQADEKMYEHKKKIKEQQTSPEEYYANRAKK